MQYFTAFCFYIAMFLACTATILGETTHDAVTLGAGVMFTGVFIVMGLIVSFFTILEGKETLVEYNSWWAKIVDGRIKYHPRSWISLTILTLILAKTALTLTIISGLSLAIIYWGLTIVTFIGTLVLKRLVKKTKNSF